MPEPDIWGDTPTEPASPPVIDELAPPWFWDHAPAGAAVALRHRDGRVLLVLAASGASWGIYQLQRHGNAMYVAADGAEWELLQARATKKEARDAALEMAERCGLLA